MFTALHKYYSADEIGSLLAENPGIQNVSAVCDCLWLIDWLIESVSQWAFDWLIDWLSRSVSELSIDWLIDWLIDWSIDWLIDWFLEHCRQFWRKQHRFWTTKDHPSCVAAAALCLLGCGQWIYRIFRGLCAESARGVSHSHHYGMQITKWIGFVCRIEFIMKKSHS